MENTPLSKFPIVKRFGTHFNSRRINVIQPPFTVCTISVTVKSYYYVRCADYLIISHNTASEHVKRNIDKGYVYKNRDIHDERKVILHLTEAGKDLLKRNSSLDEEKVSAILREMTASEKQLIQQAFQLLSERAKHV